jgi:hypothetical protein
LDWHEIIKQADLLKTFSNQRLATKNLFEKLTPGRREFLRKKKILDTQE